MDPEPEPAAQRAAGLIFSILFINRAQAAGGTGVYR